MTDTQAPILRPIEDVPEGVEVQLWTEDGVSYEGWFIYSLNTMPYKWTAEILPDSKTPPDRAKYFTLWPELPKPKNSWDGLVREREGFDVPDFLLRTIAEYDNGVPPYIDFSEAVGDAEYRILALRDFLNHYYPKERDNG